MFSSTISPYSDHNVYLSRPVCQKMVEIWFFKFKYHSICRHNGAASGGESRSDNFGHFSFWIDHSSTIVTWRISLEWWLWQHETCWKPGIIGVQSPTFAKYRKCPTNPAKFCCEQYLVRIQPHLCLVVENTIHHWQLFALDHKSFSIKKPTTYWFQN